MQRHAMAQSWNMPIVLARGRAEVATQAGAYVLHAKVVGRCPRTWPKRLSSSVELACAVRHSGPCLRVCFERQGRAVFCCCPRPWPHTARLQCKTKRHCVCCPQNPPTLHTTHFISFHLIWNLFISSHLTSSLLNHSHMSPNFVSTISISADHCTAFHSHLMQALLNSFQPLRPWESFYCQYFPVLRCTARQPQSTSPYNFALQDLQNVLPFTALYYKACTTYIPLLLCTTRLAQSISQDYLILILLKLAQRTSPYFFVLHGLRSVLPSSTWYYKACAKYFPVLLCTIRLHQCSSQFYFVQLTNLTKRTCQYYFAAHFPVLNYFVPQSLHGPSRSYFVLRQVLYTTTVYYKTCTLDFPALLGVHKTPSGTTSYYKTYKHFPVLLCISKLAESTSKNCCLYYVTRTAYFPVLCTTSSTAQGGGGSFNDRRKFQR